MARNITHLTLTSLTLALSLTGCSGRDLTLGTRDDGVNLDDDNGMTADGVGETGTGSGGGGAPSDLTISEPGFMGPAEAEEMGSGSGTAAGASMTGSGGGAAAMGTALAGAGPCADRTGGYVTADLDPDSGVKVDGDGTTTIYRRDGSRTVIAPDGTQTTTQDAMIATAEDGTQTLYFSDGTVITLLPDESVLAHGETESGATWSIEGSADGSSATGTGSAPCSGAAGGGTMDPAPIGEEYMRMCSANGDGTYTYVEADGTAVTVSRPEPLPDGTISMEEASSPCAGVWSAEDEQDASADDGGMAMGGGSAVGGASGEAEPE